MKKYMLRRPEFMEEAGKAKYMPNPFIAMLIALLIFIIFSLVGGIVIAVIFFASQHIVTSNINDVQSMMTQMLQNHGFMLGILGSEGLLALFAIIHVRKIEKRPLRTMGLVRRKFVLKYLAGFGTGAVLLLLCAVTTFFLPGLGFKGFSPIVFAYLAAFMLVGAGEEVLFRGYVLTAMMRRMGVLWSVILSSAFFALFHVQYEPVGILQVFFIGVVLALYFLRTGSLWGAMGIHAAWDFITGLFSPIAFGNYGGVDYSIATQPTAPDIFGDYVAFAVLIGFAALLLFAGKGRLVVRKTPERIMYEKAYREAKNAYSSVQSINGRPYMVYLRRVAEAAPEEAAKTAALLKYACMKGLPLGNLEKDYSPEVFYAVAALEPAGNETRIEYEQRVSQNETSASVIAAENWAVYILGPGSSIPMQQYAQPQQQYQPQPGQPYSPPQQYPPQPGQPYAPQQQYPPQQGQPYTPQEQYQPQPGQPYAPQQGQPFAPLFSPFVTQAAPPPQFAPDELIECPMMNWSIRPRRCRDIAFAVDFDRLEEELDPEVALAADKNKCRQCPNRRR